MTATDPTTREIDRTRLRNEGLSRLAEEFMTRDLVLHASGIRYDERIAEIVSKHNLTDKDYLPQDKLGKWARKMKELGSTRAFGNLIPEYLKKREISINEEEERDSKGSYLPGIVNAPGFERNSRNSFGNPNPKKYEGNQ